MVEGVAEKIQTFFWGCTHRVILQMPDSMLPKFIQFSSLDLSFCVIVLYFYHTKSPLIICTPIWETVLELVPSASWPFVNPSFECFWSSKFRVATVCSSNFFFTNRGPKRFFRARNSCGESVWNIPPLVIRTATPDTKNDGPWKTYHLSTAAILGIYVIRGDSITVHHGNIVH